MPMVCPFATDPPPPDPRACPFPEQPPALNKGMLDEPVVWQTILKQLGGTNDEDAAVIDSFAARLGIDRRRIIAKIETHYHDDNRALH
jgi:hypothetical protein